jgi:hypothetical protein
MEYLIGVLVFCVVYIFVLNNKVGDLNEQIEDLDERLTKLEKDAVKITFTSKPNPKQFDGVKSEEPFVKTRKKRKPKTVGEWEEEIDLGGHE